MWRRQIRVVKKIEAVWGRSGARNGAMRVRGRRYEKNYPKTRGKGLRSESTDAKKHEVERGRDSRCILIRRKSGVRSRAMQGRRFVKNDPKVNEQETDGGEPSWAA